MSCARVPISEPYIPAGKTQANYLISLSLNFDIRKMGRINYTYITVFLGRLNLMIHLNSVEVSSTQDVEQVVATTLTPTTL